MPVDHLYVFNGKKSTQVLYFFFIWVVYLMLSCINFYINMTYMYILNINPLSGISFACIFSHLVDDCFILFVAFFFCEKLFSFI